LAVYSYGFRFKIKDLRGENAVMIDSLETIKTSFVGLGGFWLSLWGWLPEIVSLSVGIATLIYLIIKIKKELNK
jgi:hypothetical protein